MKSQNKKYFTIILVLSFLFVAVFGLDKLTKRIPLSKDEAILEVNFNANNYVIDFSELVFGYEVNYYTNERNLNKNDAILFA